MLPACFLQLLLPSSHHCPGHDHCKNLTTLAPAAAVCRLLQTTAKTSSIDGSADIFSVLSFLTSAGCILLAATDADTTPSREHARAEHSLSTSCIIKPDILGLLLSPPSCPCIACCIPLNINAAAVGVYPFSSHSGGKQSGPANSPVSQFALCCSLLCSRLSFIAICCSLLCIGSCCTDLHC